MGDVAGVHRIRGDNNDAMPVEHCASLDKAVTLFAADPLLFEPGTQHRYSIYGWILVSAVVDGAAGEPFTRFMVPLWLTIRAGLPASWTLLTVQPLGRQRLASDVPGSRSRDCRRSQRDGCQRGDEPESDGVMAHCAIAPVPTGLARFSADGSAAPRLRVRARRACRRRARAA